MRVHGTLSNDAPPVINYVIILGGVQGSKMVPWWTFGCKVMLGDILVLMLGEAGTTGLEVTSDTVDRQQDHEGWTTAIRVMHQKGIIVIRGHQ